MVLHQAAHRPLCSMWNRGSVFNAVNNVLSGYKWRLGIGSAASLTTSFLSSGASYYNYSGVDASSPVSLNSNQIDKARLAMNAFAKVANLTFTETTDNASNAGDIRWETPLIRI